MTIKKTNNVLLKAFLDLLIEISKLSQREEEVINLKYTNNLTCLDISSELDISKPSVSMYKKRALQKLKDNFKTAYKLFMSEVKSLKYIEDDLEAALREYFKESDFV